MIERRINMSRSFSDTIFYKGIYYIWMLAAAGGAVIGACLIHNAVHRYQKTFQAGQWPEVAAVLDACILDKEKSSKGPPRYKLICQYHYDYADEHYSSSVVELQGQYVVMGNWRRELFLILSSAFSNGKPVSCYVNQANPSEACLYREPRPAEFGLIVAIGIMLIAGAGTIIFRSIHMLLKVSLQIESYPDKPWKWDLKVHQPVSGPVSSAWRWYLILGILSFPATIVVAVYSLPVLIREGCSSSAFIFICCSLAVPPALIVLSLWNGRTPEVSQER